MVVCRIVDGDWKGEITQTRRLADALPDRLANPSNQMTIPTGFSGSSRPEYWRASTDVVNVTLGSEFIWHRVFLASVSKDLAGVVMEAPELRLPKLVYGQFVRKEQTDFRVSRAAAALSIRRVARVISPSPQGLTGPRGCP
jgi:hypothetical protein